MNYKGYEITKRESGQLQIMIEVEKGTPIRLFSKMEYLERFVDNLEAEKRHANDKRPAITIDNGRRAVIRY